MRPVLHLRHGPKVAVELDGAAVVDQQVLQVQTTVIMFDD